MRHCRVPLWGRVGNGVGVAWDELGKMHTMFMGFTIGQFLAILNIDRVCFTFHKTTYTRTHTRARTHTHTESSTLPIFSWHYRSWKKVDQNVRKSFRALVAFSIILSGQIPRLRRLPSPRNPGLPRSLSTGHGTPVDHQDRLSLPELSRLGKNATLWKYRKKNFFSEGWELDIHGMMKDLTDAMTFINIAN